MDMSKYTFHGVTLLDLLFLYLIDIAICEKHSMQTGLFTHSSRDSQYLDPGRFIKNDTSFSVIPKRRKIVTFRYLDPELNWWSYGQFPTTAGTSKNSTVSALTTAVYSNSSEHKSSTNFKFLKDLSSLNLTGYDRVDLELTIETDNMTSVESNAEFFAASAENKNNTKTYYNDEFLASSDNMTSVESNAEFFAIRPDDKDDFVFPNFSLFHPTTIKKMEMRKAGPSQGSTLKLLTKNTNTNYETKLPSLNLYDIVKEIHDVILEIKKNTAVTITEKIIGQTAQSRDIVLLKITSKIGRKQTNVGLNKYAGDDSDRKIVFIVHGLSVMGFKYVPSLSRKLELVAFINTYIREGANDFDIFLIPMANPDGVYKSITDSSWNKNMSPQSSCAGVAVDRNFEVAWRSRRKGISSCSQQYHGPEPFSEPESRAVRDVFKMYGHKITAYIHVHADSYDRESYEYQREVALCAALRCGDAVLYPKGYSNGKTSGFDEYNDLRTKIEEGVKNASFKVVPVTVDTLHNWYGPVTGTSVDFASAMYGIPHAMEFVMKVVRNYEGSKKTDEERASSKIWPIIIATVFQHIADEEVIDNEVR